jgi:hypothetical protein
VSESAGVGRERVIIKHTYIYTHTKEREREGGETNYSDKGPT